MLMIARASLLNEIKDLSKVFKVINVSYIILKNMSGFSYQIIISHLIPDQRFANMLQSEMLCGYNNVVNSNLYTRTQAIFIDNKNAYQ